MKRFHVKVGEEVAVISGAHRGATGKILAIQSKKERAIVEGVNLIKKHERKSQTNPEGAIVEREGTVHISNLMGIEKYNARRSTAGGNA